MVLLQTFLSIENILVPLKSSMQDKQLTIVFNFFNLLMFLYF